MRVRIDNAEIFLNEFTDSGINIALEWIEPFGIAMIKSYVSTNKDKEFILEPCNHNVKGYLDAVIKADKIDENSTYLLQEIGKTNNEQVANFITSKILLEISDNEDKDDIKQYLRYMITEMIDNVVSHSCSIGYNCIAAQYYPKLKKIQVAIVDSGIGLMNALHKMHNPASEQDAIQKALEKEITGSNKFDSYGHQKHAGLGLFFLKRIIEETKGNILIISNDTIYFNKNKIEKFKVCKNTKWMGTAIVFELSIDSIDYEWNQIRNLIQNEVYSEKDEELEEFLF